MEPVVLKLIGVERFCNPPLFVMETEDVPSLARVTVNV